MSTGIRTDEVHLSSIAHLELQDQLRKTRGGRLGELDQRRKTRGVRPAEEDQGRKTRGGRPAEEDQPLTGTS